MVEIEGQQIRDLDRDAPGSRARIEKPALQIQRDPMMLAVIGTAVGLTLLVIAMAIFWGSGPVLAKVPWYIPLISAFVALTTLCVSYLALGRYQVLRDPLSFWIGTGFAVYGVGQIFYALTWPGLLPGGGSILGHLANTSAWIALVDRSLLAAFLLAAMVLHWPGPQSLSTERWLWPVILWVAIGLLGFSLLIALERSLPQFVNETGKYLAPMRIWMVILMITFAAGSVLSALHYRRTGDRLAGYVAFPQLALVFISLMACIGGKRYDLWWYLQRVILVSGYLAVLLGLLSEYVRLLRREREGTRLLEAILGNIPIGLSVTSGPPDFPITHLSRYGREMSQSSLAPLTDPASDQNSPGWKILFPDGKTVPTPEQLPLYRASRFGEEVRNAEFILQTRDGQQIPILVNASPIRDGQGNILAAVNTWMDITDRKRAEGILRESEALYRAIARSIPNGAIFVLDRNLRYLIAEGPVVEKLGYSREMLEGHSISEIFSLDTAAKMEARFHRVFAGETISYEMEHNGRIYWTQHALLDDPPDHTIVITLDITDRKQVERALGDSEQRFRAIVNQATAGILRTDMDGQLVFVNRAFCRMLGFTESELSNKTIWSLTHPDDLEENKRLYERLLEKGMPFQLEKRFLHRDGSILWVNVSTAPILDTLGKTQSVVSIVADITERKQAEADLHQLNLQLENRVKERTAELEAANEALLENRRRLEILSQRLVEVQEQERQALARELHDRVSQSLTALNLNLTIIGNQMSAQVAPSVSNRLADSIKLVTEMIAIVRDVMSDLRPVVLDEYGLVAALQAYIGKFETRYGIHVEFIQPQPAIPRLGAAMEMTVLRIAEEALLNVARHAQASEVILSLQVEERAVRLTVQDNGIGLRASQGTANNGHGLIIMRERAEAVGGTLTLLSLPGKGTTVEAHLPIPAKSKEIQEEAYDDSSFAGR